MKERSSCFWSFCVLPFYNGMVLLLQAERGGISDEAEESTDLADFNGVEDINMYQFPYQ